MRCGLVLATWWLKVRLEVWTMANTCAASSGRSALPTGLRLQYWHTPGSIEEEAFCIASINHGACEANGYNAVRPRCAEQANQARSPAECASIASGMLSSAD